MPDLLKDGDTVTLTVDVIGHVYTFDGWETRFISAAAAGSDVTVTEISDEGIMVEWEIDEGVVFATVARAALARQVPASDRSS